MSLWCVPPVGCLRLRSLVSLAIQCSSVPQQLLQEQRYSSTESPASPFHKVYATQTTIRRYRSALYSPTLSNIGAEYS
ncbi:hypothetical protein EB796_003661 [Bugula neritina]|uniref:Uncharacterized protein n=1 Tax=Bugula neritina TaxID=10212 RepID=A0A7J7KJH9_BUGNE|nr:hypothetical protein EB796_003661 [Bugula neritina]